MKDRNKRTIHVMDAVKWHDPEESARDLSRIYTVYRTSGETVLIADEYSEAEVLPKELEVVS